MWFWRELVLFYIGGLGYIGLEVLFRGYSHPSMFLVGGLCFLLIGLLPASLSLTLRAFLGAGIITTLEYCSGMLLNRVLHLGVWDYSHLPGNVQGQICPYFTALWVVVSFGAIFADDWLRHVLFGETMPGYRLF